MSEPHLPDVVQELILERIESVAQLEALLLMRRTADQVWTVQELAGQLYIPPQDASLAMGALIERGFCQKKGDAALYQPESPELEAAVALLADTYREKLIPVTKLIHQRAKKPGVQQFADVFRIRKEE